MTSKTLLLILCLLYLVGCMENKTNEENVEIKVANKGIPVSLIVIDTNDVFSTKIISNGKIKSVNSYNLSFNADNIISNIRVRNGEIVKKGQILAILKNEILKNEVDMASIELEESKIRLSELTIEYNLEENYSQEKKEEIIYNLKIKSGFFAAKNKLQNLNLKYNQTILRAPYSGLVANIQYTENDFISNGAFFCSILDIENQEVQFNLLENEVSHISLGQKVEVIPFNNKQKILSGFITEINPYVDVSGFILVKAGIEGSNNIIDGINAQIHIKKELKNILSIPKEAVILRSNRHVVFSVKKNVAKWNYVEVYAENDDYYGILSGISIGDSIIVSGNQYLSHNAAINPIDLTK